MSASAPLGVLATFVSINIATIGIVNSFVLSRYNERASRRKAVLGVQLAHLLARTLKLPGKLGPQSIRILTNEHRQIEVLTVKSRYVFFGIPPLSCFLISFIISYIVDFGGTMFPQGPQIDTIIPSLLAHLVFMLGIILIIPYVYSLMRLLWAFLRFYSPKKCEGTLRWANLKLTDKTITRSFKKEDRLKVPVFFEGFVVNGFFDTLLIYTDGKRDFQIWIPDKLTYLSTVGYGVTGILYIDERLDTGILQGRVNEAFPLEFRVGESSHRPEVIDYIWRGEDYPVFYDYFIPEGMQIKELRIRMYVDPFHSPRLERTFLDELVIRNSDVLEPQR